MTDTHQVHDGTANGNVDPSEVARFAGLASEWWNAKGKFRALHRQGPARLAFIRAHLARRFGPPAEGQKPLARLKIVDVGCGGGLACEPLARLGASVTGIDPAPQNIAIARAHAAPQGLDIDYRAADIAQLARRGETFDVALCLEVVEHVPDPATLIRSCAAVVRPGGLLIVSTLNRTLKAYALAIVAAEYVLGWLPPGTHQWERFVTPEELSRHLTSAGLSPPVCEGIVYDPFQDTWKLGSDLAVNYMAAADKPAS